MLYVYTVVLFARSDKSFVAKSVSRLTGDDFNYMIKKDIYIFLIQGVF